jgi:hypothetical protein
MCSAIIMSVPPFLHDQFPLTGVDRATSRIHCGMIMKLLQPSPQRQFATGAIQLHPIPKFHIILHKIYYQMRVVTNTINQQVGLAIEHKLCPESVITEERLQTFMANPSISLIPDPVD